MRKTLLLSLGFFLLSACGNTDVKYKVLIGATTVTALGAKPIEDSVVLIGGSKIRAVGERKDVPIPQNSDRTDLTGKWIVPAAGSTIESGGIANLLVLDHPPAGVVPTNPGDVGASLVAGEWKASK
ncbi:MAG TPA: hypothetical protein VG273_08680 [Bryobacteraceae bacterium]|jgi:hypothetical protein|nr:hypothetical protein [Bryobacteraceae bacterium]